MASSRGSKKKTQANASVAPSPPLRAEPPKWVIVQLSSLGEKEKDIALIERSVRRILGKNVEVFIPAISQRARDESQTLFYMEGYIFVKFEEGISYQKLQDTMYFGSVLTQSSSGRQKVYSLLHDKELVPMREGMDRLRLGSFREGDLVKIIQGRFKDLNAEVSYVHDGGKTVQVYVKMRSKQVLMDFPASYLIKT